VSERIGKTREHMIKKNRSFDIILSSVLDLVVDPSYDDITPTKYGISVKLTNAIIKAER